MHRSISMHGTPPQPAAQPLPRENRALPPSVKGAEGAGGATRPDHEDFRHDTDGDLGGRIVTQ
ncbi:MAG TPA: hypothetical protein PKM88_15610, partial [bacterium]|nr:hypothetical protein [bacterium]